MTDAQTEIWIAAQMGPAANVFIESYVLELEGSLDLPVFRQAVHDAVNRHDALRTSFGTEGEATVAPEVSVDVPVADLTAQPDPLAAATAVLDEEARTPFDLTKGPLVRVRVLKLADNRHWVALTVHQLACDFRAVAVLVRELASIYTDRVRDRTSDLPSAPSFHDSARNLADRLVGPEGSRIATYWRQQFAEAPPAVELPVDRPRTAKRSYRGGSLRLPLGEHLTTATRDAASREGVTAESWLLAGFHVLLHRLTGQTDIVVGTITAGQMRAAQPHLVGHCADFLPIRAAIDPAKPFRDHVRAVNRVASEAVGHSPFTFLGRRTEAGTREAAFAPPSTAFAVEPSVGDLTLGPATARVRRNARHFVNFDLQVTLADTGSDYVAEFAYNADLYDRATVERWAGHYRTLLESAIADPSTATARLGLLTPAELRRLTDEFNATSAEYPRDRCAHELVAEQARRHPDRTAVECRDAALTYAELDARANRLAHHLRALHVGPNVPVGVCLDRCPELVVSLLAVWKAGAAYVPLDPDFPPDRLQLYLQDSDAPVLITRAALKDRLPDSAARVVDLDADAAQIDSQPPECPDSGVSPSDLAYLIYTSGSTGTPNGVEVHHQALVNFLTSLRREPGLSESDVLAALTTVSFDIHHLELWLPLSTGARVALLGREVRGDGARLAEELARVGATVLQATPSAWRLLVASGWAGDPHLKALCGGEPMPPELAAALLGKVGELWNVYGPTETTVWSTLHRVTDPTGPIPIGHPIANTQVYVLDSDLRPVPVGCVGEVYIGGEGVARGYRERPELTATRFVADPFRLGNRMYKTGDLGRWRDGGILECLGRIDQQVKVGGNRIELGEIETALAAHPSVAVAAARVWGQPPQLVAYVVSRAGAPRAPELLRQHLRGRLPGYMVPGLITFLDSLPQTPNGKIDRKALPEPVSTVTEQTSTSPRTDAERDVLAIWCDVFGRSEFGVTDNFFEMGGTSLQAAEVVAGIRRRLGHTIALGAMYEAATVEKMAELIHNRLEGASPSSLVPLQTGGSRPPLVMIAGIGGHVFTLHKFARKLGADYTVYGMKAIGIDGDRPPPETFEEIAAEYVREITAAQPRGPYLLSGYSIGSHVALEVGLQLQALGHEVPLVVVFDMPAPGYPPPLSLPRRLTLHARNLFRRDGGGLQYVTRRLRNIGNRVLRSLGLEKLLFPSHPSLNSLPQEALKEVWVSMQRASRKYRPNGLLKGTVVLFRSEVPLDVWNAVVHTDPYLGWGERTSGPVEVHHVSRGHLEMFHDSNIDPLAGQVAALIDRVADVPRPAPRRAESSSREMVSVG